MQFVIQQNFTAQPFIGTGGIPANTLPKDFITGSTVDATEQMNSSRQMVWVSSDGYTLDMTKVSAALNPNVTMAPSISATPLSLQVVQSFTAVPFSFNSAIPTTTAMKTFIAGQHIEAQQQLNSLQQPFLVSTDGYVVDISKVRQINYPLYQPQYQQYQQYQPQYSRPRYFDMGEDTAPVPTPVAAKTPEVAKTPLVVQMPSNQNLMKIALVVIILFVGITMIKKMA